MHQKIRLSKRQIKEDKFTTVMLQSRTWFEANWQFVAIGVAAAILIVSGFTYWSNSRDAAGYEAAGTLSRAMSEYRSGNLQVATLSLQSVLDNHSGSSAATQATFLLGNINLESRNYPEAARFYEMYLAKHKDDKITRASCLAGIATCDEDQAKFAEAAGRFSAAYDELTTGPQSGDYLTGAMRNYLQAGDIGKAKEKLDIITRDFDGTTLASRAIRLFSELSVGC